MRITRVFSKKLSRVSINTDTYSSTMEHLKMMFNLLKKDFPFIRPCDVEVVQYDSHFIKHMWGLEIVIKDPAVVPSTYSQYEQWEDTFTPRNPRNAKHEMVKSYAPPADSTYPGHYLIRTKRAGNTFQMFLDFLHEARKDFPTLKDSDVQLEEYAGTTHRHTIGMEWKEPLVPGTKRKYAKPAAYKQIDQLEFTL